MIHSPLVYRSQGFKEFGGLLAHGRVGIAYGLMQLGPGAFDLFLGKHQKLVGFYRG